MKTKLTTQPQAIRYFIEKMDIEMIDAFLDDDKTYHNLSKSLFLSKLQIGFEKFKSFGDTQLISDKGNCESCDKTKTGFVFIGNNSKNYMSLLFTTADDRIIDLYECINFKNKNSNLNLKWRVFIVKELILPL